MNKANAALFLLLASAVVSGAQSASQIEDRNQPFRSQVHYSPERNWMNDPNGPVYFDGEYHLFYQYNPHDEVMGHINWGHAVSPDLLHWQELGVAIPEADGEMAFTGSVVVDKNNTSGLCEGGRPCLVAVYTGHRDIGSTARETQDLAVSQDRGRTWKRYSRNPVLDLGMSNFRDPSVTWNTETNSWLMAVSLPNDHEVAFYTSQDLKKWSLLSKFGPSGGATGGQWECPNLLHIPTADGLDSIWALKVGINPGALQRGSGEQYFLGSFDGNAFTQSSEAGSHGWTDYGKDSYCAIGYNNLPDGDKPTLIGWMDNWQYAGKLPTAPWRGQMTLPRRVTLVHDGAGLALAQDPLIAPLRDGPAIPIKITLANKAALSEFKQSLPAEFVLSFEPSDANSFGVRLYSDPKHWTEIGFDRVRMKLYVDRSRSGKSFASGFLARIEAPLAKGRPTNLHLVVDRSSVEVFAQNETISMTNLVFPNATSSVRLQAFRRGGKQPIRLTGNSWKLKSIWNVATP